MSSSLVWTFLPMDLLCRRRHRAGNPTLSVSLHEMECWQETTSWLWSWKEVVIICVNSNLVQDSDKISVLICFTVSLRTWNILPWLSPVFWKTHLLSYLNRLIIIYDYCKSILTVCGKFNWHAKTERIGKGKMPLSKTKSESEKIAL